MTGPERTKLILITHSVREAGQKVGKCIPFRGPLMRSANRGNSCNNRLRRSSAPNRPDCRGEEDRPQTQRALRKRVLHAVARPVRRPRPPIVPRDTTSKSSPSVSFWDRGRRTGDRSSPTSIQQSNIQHSVKEHSPAAQQVYPRLAKRTVYLDKAKRRRHPISRKWVNG